MTVSVIVGSGPIPIPIELLSNKRGDLFHDFLLNAIEAMASKTGAWIGFVRISTIKNHDLHPRGI